MKNSHYLCSRCGIIFIGYSEGEISFCEKCGGVKIHDIGQDGDYTVKQVRKLYHAPFRPDVFCKKDG